MGPILRIFMLLLCFWTSLALVKLKRYNIDPKSITVSGISSGGAMANQIHFIHSDMISGAGIFAGIPYLCRFIAGSSCLFNPETMNVTHVLIQVERFSRMGLIDSTKNLRNQRAYIFHGTLDEQPLMLGEKAAEMYEHYGVQLKTEFKMLAHHGQPTDAFGPRCTTPDSESLGIINCDYNGAFEALDHLLGGVQRPPVSLDPSLHVQIEHFDQSEFLGDSQNHPTDYQMSDSGFLYVPSGCRDLESVCRLHVVFHGCGQTEEDLGDIFVSKTSYIETGEANDIIMLFPQSKKNSTAGNPRGCWNWWGFQQPQTYPTRNGFQTVAVHRMISRLLLG